MQLKEKDVVWKEICNKYNQSTLIFQDINNYHKYINNIKIIAYDII